MTSGGKGSPGELHETRKGFADIDLMRLSIE